MVNDELRSAQARAVQVLRRLYEGSSTVQNGSFHTTLNQFTDQTTPLAAEDLLAVALPMALCVPPDTDCIFGEEDKGAHIATAVSLLTGLPLVLARTYTYELTGAHEWARTVDISHEYFQGSLTVNGLRPGKRLVIIEDTVSTGGTLVGLLELARSASATVLAVFAAVEKVNYGGLERVREAHQVTVSTNCKIRATPSGVEFLGPGSAPDEVPPPTLRRLALRLEPPSAPI